MLLLGPTWVGLGSHLAHTVCVLYIEYVLLQKHKGRLSGSFEVSNKGTMDRMFSTPLANKERGITHRISRSRADFWKEEQNQPQDKSDTHTGLLLVRPPSTAKYMPGVTSAACWAACHLLCLVAAAFREAEQQHG